MVGTWKIDVAVGGMPQKLATAFGKLSESLVGASYNPIAYLGSQLVNGINHAVLAEQTLTTANGSKNIVVMIFNEKPSSMDDPTLVNIERVVEGGNGFGGTQIDVETEINKTAQGLFDKAFGGFVGSVVTPFALLGTQVVRGTNFIFACESTPVLADNDGDFKKVVIVTINDTDNGVSFTDLLESKLNVALGAPLGEWP